MCLSVESELKILRVIKRLKKTMPIEIKSTFLGAHAFPKDFQNNHAGYVELIINEMLPIIESEKLAEYIDVYAFWGLAIGFPFAYPDKIGAIAILVCASLYFSAWLSWFGRAHHKKIAGLYQLAGLAYLWILAYTEYFDGLMS